MAKTMALVADGIVANILWCADNAAPADSLISVADRPVSIGDAYADGKFYRGGAEVLTPLEAANAEIERLRAEMEDMQEALTTLGVSVDG